MRRTPCLLGLFLAVLLVLIGTCPSASQAKNGLMLLRGIIAQYNRSAIQRSLKDKTYRGEAGILRMRPGVGNGFGLKVQVDDNYKQAAELMTQAEDAYIRILEGLKKKRRSGLKSEDVDRLLDLAISYNTKKSEANSLFLAYFKSLDPKRDQRLDEGLCLKLLVKELRASLSRYRNKLRDSLADFYNRTHGGSEIDPPLRPANVEFVNSVFHQFSTNASHQILEKYDLDSFLLKADSVKPEVWKMLFPPRLRYYGEIVERLYLQTSKKGYPAHPVLFMALMRRESNFDPTAVSNVGAVGLTQIMPSTAKLLGMNTVYLPSYFRKAREFLRQARLWRAKALALVDGIREKEGREKIRKAWEYMQKAETLAAKSGKLFHKYERDLLKRRNDDRLDVEKAIMHGYKYFAEMLKRYKGDISLALAAYNAGPSRVKQYGGIPPFPETVAFRNAVLKYYEEYLSRLGIRGR